MYEGLSFILDSVAFHYAMRKMTCNVAPAQCNHTRKPPICHSRLLGSGLYMEEEEVEEGLVGGTDSPVVLPVSPAINSSGSTYSSC